MGARLRHRDRRGDAARLRQPGAPRRDRCRRRLRDRAPGAFRACPSRRRRPLPRDRGRGPGPRRRRRRARHVHGPRRPRSGPGHAARRRRLQAARPPDRGPPFSPASRNCPKPVTLCLVGRDGGALLPNAALVPTLRDAARRALGRRAIRRRPGRSGGRLGGRPARQDRRRGSAAAACAAACAVALCAAAFRPDRRALLRRHPLRRRPGNPPPRGPRRRLQRAGPGAPHPSRPRAAIPIGPPPRPNRRPLPPAGHVFLDLGADEYTAGRPHPMIRTRDALGSARRDPRRSHGRRGGARRRPRYREPSRSRPHRSSKSSGRRLPTARPSSPRCAAPSSTPRTTTRSGAPLERAGVLVAGSNADAVEAAIRIARAAGGVRSRGRSRSRSRRRRRRGSR